jgi:hypothetical protein
MSIGHPAMAEPYILVLMFVRRADNWNGHLVRQTKNYKITSQTFGLSSKPGRLR